MSTVNSQTTYDPTHGGLFTTPRPYVDPDEYVQPENKQDLFDWKLTKVSDVMSLLDFTSYSISLQTNHTR